MTQRSRASRTLLGCGIACGAAALLLVGGCFAFQSWLKRPGEVLDTAAMLDPAATAYVAARLDLADPATRELVEQLVAASQRPFQGSARERRLPFMDFLIRSNQQRQQRDLERLFPMTATWVVWPGEKTGGGAVTVSARGLGNQALFLDWVFGLFGSLGKVPSRQVAGETVYEVELAPEQTVFAFLESRGAVVCFDEEAVAPAVERLRATRGQALSRSAPGELERRLAAVPADLPLRGAFVGRDGGVARVLGVVAPGAPAGAWDAIAAATVAGRFTGGAVALTLDLALDPAAPATARPALVTELEQRLAAQWGEGSAAVREAGDAVVVELLVDDLPRRVEELQSRQLRRARERAERGATAD